MTTGTDFALKVLHTVRRHGMLVGGETVLVGVSGGADSVALLHVLRALGSRLGLTLHAIHVNHGLRPEADSEAACVEALGRRWDVPVRVERIQVAAPPGQSLEAWARGRRYAAFRAWATAVGAARVALGHTADDQAETVLMRVLEGAGPRGLAGIPPVRGLFIRPLIDLRRREIEAELERAGIAWVEDLSNRDPKFLRNRIRHELLPHLSSAYNPRIAEALCLTGALARDLVQSVEELAARELEGRARVEPDGLVLCRADLLALPPAIAGEVLRQGLVRLGGPRPLRAWEHRALRQLLATGSPGSVRLGGIMLEVSGDRFRLSGARMEPLPETVLPVPGSIVLPGAGLALGAREFERPGSYRPPTDPWTVVFDRADLPLELGVRGRRPGDQFHPFGAPGSKRLKSFLIDVKIPRWQRDQVPLLLAGGEIAWIVGVRRGALAPVTASTSRILEVTATPLAAAGLRSKMGA